MKMKTLPYALAVLTAFTAVTANAEMVPLYADMDAQSAHYDAIGGYKIANGSGGGWFKDALGNSLYLTGGLGSIVYAGGKVNNPYFGNTEAMANATPLAESSYTAMQQAQIQSLYDHVYYKAYNQDSYTPGQFVNDSSLAHMFGLALDMIMYSQTPNGQLLLQKTGSSGPDDTYCYFYADFPWITVGVSLKQAAGELLQSWVDAINNDAWDLLGGYDKIHVEITSYDLQYGSGVDSDWSNTYKMLGVAGNTSATPEPATMLIFGIGIAGFAAARRMKRK